MSLHVWSSAKYTFPLPDGHRFPISKYAVLRDRVLAEGVVAREDVHEPARVPRDDLLLVHTADYVDRFTRGELTRDEERRLGFPWSEALVERSYRTAGATVEVARHALDHGIAMNLAGGTHHAFPDHGEGYCVFNDVAIAIRALQRDGRIARAAVVDLDVHQGNGTHAVFAGDERVFTFSMHGGKNYPFHKVPGRADIELADGTGDDEYLALLADALPPVLAAARPELVIYLAGADPHEHDRLGRLSLSFDGLARRDTLVIERCREAGIPVALTIAGGYGVAIDETVRIHVETARIAAGFASSR
ncbi:MAG: Histone deacetylase domain protein [Gemmatimonadetes bacterium]|nr:Histone deacetylase domain protein [Gemmatimonadota bacterium]